MSIIWTCLYVLFSLLGLVLIVRLIFDLVQSFARSWRPQGIALLAASAVYSVTDPLVKFIRSKIPPINFGGISLDLAFIILLVLTQVFARISYSLA